MICNLCYGRGYIYHHDQEEYDVEVCPCMRGDLKNETD
jgi:hypothetical protein